MRRDALPELPVLVPGAVKNTLGTMPKKALRPPPIKRRYSVTSDVLAYRRCKRQYGFFVRRGYTSAQSGQLFFGTVIHETLDRAHAHYRGELEGTVRGSIPTESDIEAYFAAAERGLRARGVHPLSRESRDAALRYVKTFNEEQGPSVYPRVVDTEHRLQKDKGTYVLHGIVDVIAEAKDYDPTRDGEWGRYEI